ncbi:MAG: hypothetical protein WC005_10835, partial [Candidatus Nanopelagicales bacterium]
AVILVFIGVKLVLTWASGIWPEVPHISTNQSLLFIAVVLVVVVIASGIKVRRDPAAIAHAGRMTEPHAHLDDQQ